MSPTDGECLGGERLLRRPPHGQRGLPPLPLVLRWPGVTTGLADEQRHVGGVVYHIDRCLTIGDLSAIPVPPGSDGPSFAPGVRGEDFSGRDHLVLSHGSYTYQRAVRTSGRCTRAVGGSDRKSVV